LGTEAWRWTAAGGMVGLGDLTGGKFYSWATGVSANGSVVVGQGSSTADGEAFRWTASGGMVGLGDLPGGSFSSIAFGLSADGSVVVGQGSSALGDEAFICDGLSGMRSLRQVLGPTVPAGWTLTVARGVALNSGAATIVGYGTNPLGYREAWIATVPVPEPSGLLSLLPGLLAAASLARRGRG